MNLHPCDAKNQFLTILPRVQIFCNGLSQHFAKYIDDYFMGVPISL